MYKISSSFSGGATAVPTDIIDKYLKLAPSASFKVLLFIFRNPDNISDEKQISLCTGLPEGDVKDCLSFWEEHGVIKRTDEEPKDATLSYKNLKTAEVDALNSEAPSRKKSAPVRLPTQSEVSKRLSEDSTLASINTEAQLILGTYGYRMQAVIVLLFDHYALPPEVIITLLQYQKDLGNVSPEAVKARGESWANKGITTLPLLNEELKALSLIDSVFKEVKLLTGLLQKTATGKTATYLRDWAVTWGFSADMILLALKENGNSFAEANKQLKKWFKDSIFSPEDIKKRRSAAPAPVELKKSYSTDSIGKNSVLSWLQNEKKEENAN